jgi:Cu-processing system ATP-binding protein
MNAPVIRAVSLHHYFGPVRALSGIDLEIGPGERIALVGHNGAGKTTFIRLVLGLLRPSRGSLSVLGGAPGDRAARSASAYLPENLAFHGALTGREQLSYLASLKGIRIEAGAMAERVGLRDQLDRRIATYSKGMRQRLGLAQLLIGKPRLVILDEPTTGLDPVSRSQFYDLVSQLAREGATVIQSSHVLTELEARTDRIVILREGRIAADGDLAALRLEANLPLRIRVVPHPDKKEQLAARLGGRMSNGKAVELRLSSSQKMERISQIGRNARDIEDVDIFQPSLEELYVHFSERGRSDAKDRQS